MAQWLYSHEYELVDCVDLCEWAVDLLMFGVRSFDKTSRAVSAANSVVVEKPGKQANASTRNKRLSIKQQQNLLQPINLLPTIQDDVESKSVQREIRSKAEDDFENLVTNTLAEQKDDLFSGKSSSPRVQLG